MIQSNRVGGKGSERPEIVLGNKWTLTAIYTNLNYWMNFKFYGKL